MTKESSRGISSYCRFRCRQVGEDLLMSIEKRMEQEFDWLAASDTLWKRGCDPRFR